MRSIPNPRATWPPIGVASTETRRFAASRSRRERASASAAPEWTCTGRGRSHFSTPAWTAASLQRTLQSADQIAQNAPLAVQDPARDSLPGRVWTPRPRVRQEELGRPCARPKRQVATRASSSADQGARDVRPRLTRSSDAARPRAPLHPGLGDGPGTRRQPRRAPSTRVDSRTAEFDPGSAGSGALGCSGRER